MQQAGREGLLIASIGIVIMHFATKDLGCNNIILTCQSPFLSESKSILKELNKSINFITLSF